MDVMILETGRLILRRFTFDDAVFIVDLLNQPSFIENIGDRGVRNVEDAKQYLTNGPLAMYERFGFGLWAVELKTSGALIGMCGILQRDSLEHPDLGFAFLPQFWSSGYARESASAVMEYGRGVLRLGRIVAITAPENRASIRLLEKIGFQFERMIQMSAHAGDTRLFVNDP